MIVGYGISALANILSTIANGTNVILTTENISKLRQILKEAQVEEENMKKEIENLYLQISKIYEGTPKYNYKK